MGTACPRKWWVSNPPQHPTRKAIRQRDLTSLQIHTEERSGRAAPRNSLLCALFNPRLILNLADWRPRATYGKAAISGIFARRPLKLALYISISSNKLAWTSTTCLRVPCRLLCYVARILGIHQYNCSASCVGKRRYGSFFSNDHFFSPPSLILIFLLVSQIGNSLFMFPFVSSSCN